MKDVSFELNITVNGSRDRDITLCSSELDNITPHEPVGTQNT